MKYILIILLIFSYSCKGQQSNTLTYYKTHPVDSIIFSLLNKIDDMTVEHQQEIDSCNTLIELLQSAFSSNEITAVADTFNFEVVDDRIKVEVSKKGHDVWVLIEDGSKRINADFINNKRSIILADSNKVKGIWYPE